jgi:hypothetical protein
MKTTKLNCNDPNQAEFFGIVSEQLCRRFRLAAGDVFYFDNRLCRVVRVNECAAVVLMNRPPREFETRFRGPVKFQPPPRTFRISPQSEVEILNGKHCRRRGKAAHSKKRFH